MSVHFFLRPLAGLTNRPQVWNSDPGPPLFETKEPAKSNWIKLYYFRLFHFLAILGIIKPLPVKKVAKTELDAERKQDSRQRLASRPPIYGITNFEDIFTTRSWMRHMIFYMFIRRLLSISSIYHFNIVRLVTWMNASIIVFLNSTVIASYRVRLFKCKVQTLDDRFFQGFLIIER